MKPGVFVIAENIFSPIGATSADNFIQLKNGISGIKQHHDPSVSERQFYASLFDKKIIDALEKSDKYTLFEQLIIASVTDAVGKCDIDLTDKRTLFIVSTTKGSISLLETEPYDVELKKRIALSYSAKLIAHHFGFVNTPLVISNACISGVMAIITGMRLIEAAQYDKIVVTGADVISRFILSGFEAFNAISSMPCRPFDKDRDGITLGEGAATVILSSSPNSTGDIKILGGAVSNDANHLSAPSRTGEELAMAIEKTLAMANVAASTIDLLSAHGTATIYNDEMEAKAITIAGLQNTPVNSLKGYYGHTLGAAGLIESIVSMHSLKENTIIPTLGFNATGTPDPLNIFSSVTTGNFINCVKTASGFGGCNAALLFTKQLN